MDNARFSWKFRAVLAPLALGASFASFASAQCENPPSSAESTTGLISELAVDDSGAKHPSNPWWTNLPHLNGLGVKAEDINKDGFLDVVIGGNGPTPIQVFYLQVSAGQVTVVHTEVLSQFPWPGVAGCYGVDFSDVNADGKIDLVVSRRKGSSFWPLASQRDTVWLNDGSGPNYFETAWDLPVDPAVEFIHPTAPAFPLQYPESESFGIECARLDGTTALIGNTVDIIVVGDFGIRLYAGSGDGTFVHAATYTEAGTVGTYRNVTFGDLDMDGDTDMFVPRANGAVSDRVWFNNGPASTPLFTRSNMTIKRPPTLQYEWRIASSTSCASITPTCGLCPVGDAGTFDGALGDLDNDGDLDLAIACPSSENAAYLNDGLGNFGSVSGTEGAPHWVFDTPTPTWPVVPGQPGAFARSPFLYELHKALGFSGAFAPSQVPSEQCFEFRVDGKILDFSSSPWIDDFDRDGKSDVVFANRNDIEEICRDNLAALSGGPFHYLGANDDDAPDEFDYLYFNDTSSGGPLHFKSCPEAIGRGNDGTSYIETVQIGGTRERDWIESNFANSWVDDASGTATQGTGQDTHLFFGQPVIVPWFCVEKL